MNTVSLTSDIISIFTKPLLTISGTEVTLFSILLFCIILLVSFIISTMLQRIFTKALAKQFAKREGTLAALLRLLHYSIIIIGLGIGLQTIGINISALFAAGAVFAIAIGFAMQNIVQNFVSGVILLLERSIKPGDILEVEGTVVKVIDMRIRTTVVRTWREEELIMPNSIFSQSTVKNYTLRDNLFRMGVMVGVSYDSDMEQVITVLERCAARLNWVLDDPPPRALLQDFGSSSVDFSIYVTIDDPWKQRIYMAELRKEIWFEFKKEDITIAYPQMDLHLDPPVTEALAKNLQRVK